MKKIVLATISAVLLAGCATSTTKVNKGVISGYSDKMANEARIVGDLRVEIVKTVTHQTDRPCSTLEFVKHVIDQDKSIHDVLNIRSEESYKNTTSEGGAQQRSVLGCDYIGLAVRYVPVEGGVAQSAGQSGSTAE